MLSVPTIWVKLQVHRLRIIVPNEGSSIKECPYELSDPNPSPSKSYEQD